MADDDYVFPGFYDPREYDGYSKLPHDFIDDALSRINNLAEMKVVLYVLRHTWGFQEIDTWKYFSIDHFMNGRMYSDGRRMDSGTGLSEMSVRHGLKKAVEHGYLCEKVDKRDLARIRKSYKLKIRQTESGV